MFGEIANTFEVKPISQDNLKAAFNKSKNMQEVLFGTPQVNSSYFIDSLQRFRKDYATCHKQERQAINEKQKTLNAKRQQHMLELKNQYDSTNTGHDMKQATFQSYQQQLLDMGLKKNGMTTGIPVNPVTHEYSNNYRGQQFERQQSEKKLNNMLRSHHLQTNNTCGYNVINGKQNLSVKKLVPQHLAGGMDSRMKEYRDYYSLRPQ